MVDDGIEWSCAPEWLIGLRSPPCAELTAAGLAPTNNLESAIVAMLPPGSYTAVLTGLNNATENGVVEVYESGATLSRPGGGLCHLTQS